MEAISDNHSDIRKYGGTNEAEFFAVASEYFFERPDLLKKKCLKDPSKWNSIHIS